MAGARRMLLLAGMACSASALNVTSALLGQGDEGSPALLPPAVEARFVVATCIFLIITFLVSCTVLFEWMKDTILESASVNLRPILLAMFSEMTVLGFIGIIAFFINKSTFLVNISMNLFGTDDEESKELTEMFENVHMMLFLVMILFIFQVLKLVMEGGKIEKYWHKMQADGWNMADLKGKYKDILQDLRHHPLEPFFDPRRETFHTYKNLLEFNSLREEFIGTSKDDHDREKLPHDFDFAKYLSMSMGEILAEMVELPLWTWLGLELIALCFYGIQTVCPPVVLMWVWIAFGASQSLLMHAMLHKIEAIRLQLMHVRTYAGVEEHHMVDHIVGPTSPVGRLAKYLCCCCFSSAPPPPPSSLAGKGSINGEGTALLPLGSDFADHDKPYLKQKSTGKRSWLRRKLLGPPPNKQEMLFWCEGMGVELHLFIMRVTLIGEGIYLSLFFWQFLPFAQTIYGPGMFTLVVLLGLVPVLFLFGYYSPNVIRQHSLVTSVEMMKRPLIVRRIIRDQKTQKSVRALILLNQMRIASEKQKRGEGGPMDPAMRARKRAESLLSMDQLKRMEMEKMFDLYDDDDSGEIDTAELGQLMNSLGRVMTEPELRAMFAELDEDQDGTVSKQEFLTWAAFQDAHAEKPESIEELAENMFKMFDTDDGGEVTVEEFADCMKRFGSALTVDEISELVHELDENQDGTINVEEFAEMLKKHAADWR